MRDEVIAFLFGVLFALLLLARYLEAMKATPLDQENCHRYQTDCRRMVVMPDRQPWVNYTGESGDVDVMPIGEEHTAGTGCVCYPTAQLAGSHLVIIHNAFDKREIIEQAVAVINGSFVE